MLLPEELENDYMESLTKLEEERNMRYVTTVERRGIAKGLEKGLEKGREEVREEGLVAHKTSLNTILRSRFNQVSDATLAALEAINDLETLNNIVSEPATEYNATKKTKPARRKPT